MNNRARTAVFVVPLLALLAFGCDGPVPTGPEPAATTGEDSPSLSATIGTGTESASGPFAYVANTRSGTVTVIDTKDRSVVDEIYLGGTLNGRPFGVAITPDGAFVYVANAIPDRVSVIETATNTVVAEITGLAQSPRDLSITPDGRFVYVANANANQFSVIETATNTLVAIIPAGRFPHTAAFTPDGEFAYLTNDSYGERVHVIETDQYTTTTTLWAGYRPAGAAVTPDGAFLYVADFMWAPYAKVMVFSTATNTLVRSIQVASLPLDLAITPDGAFAYVTHGIASNTISVIETATNTVVKSITAGSSPSRVAFTPDGAFAYVTDWNLGGVMVLETATNTVVETIPTGASASGVAIGPDPRTPEKRIALLIVSVQDLVDQGLLRAGSANGLISKLEEALKKIQKDRSHVAVNKLKDFADQVEGLIGAGKISSQDGQALIVEAQSVIDALST